MSSVKPKLLYSPSKHGDIKVWEITEKGRRPIYYERVDIEGLRPKGTLSSFSLGKSKLRTFEVVISRTTPRVLKIADGYTAPSTWYEAEDTILSSSPDFDEEDYPTEQE